MSFSLGKKVYVHCVLSSSFNVARKPCYMSSYRCINKMAVTKMC